MIISSFSLTVNSQGFEFEISGIPISDENGILINPYTGGLSSPKIELADLDDDGDFDIYLLDESGFIQTYINIGSSEISDFAFAELDFQSINAGSWFHFIDGDLDGDMDLFTSPDFGNISYYENVGSAGDPNYLMIDSALIDSSGDNILIGSGSLPTTADIDTDGDLDLFIGSPIGTVTFYENIGVSGSGVPIFKFITNQWDMILVIGPSLSKSAHGANSFTFSNIDADRDLDLIWGDLFNKSLYFYLNIGTPQAAHMVQKSSSWLPGAGLSTGGFNSPRFVDMDDDSDFDLFISVLGNLFDDNSTDNLHFYSNTGSDSTPSFSLISKNVLSVLDLGSRSVPTLADLDLDGDLDLLVGDDFRRETSMGGLTFIENIGTAYAPFFQVRDTEFDTLRNTNYSPTLADLDDDDIPEIFVGNFDGELIMLKNIGVLPSLDYVISDTMFSQIDVGMNSYPAFVDIDNDHDLDLFIGESNGNINFYENTGDSADHNFFLIDANFMNIDVGSSSVPNFFDYDLDGDMDMVIGNSLGDIALYRNDSQLPVFLFNLVDATFDDIRSGSFSAPAIGDIDNDGDQDLFLGTGAGGLQFYRNTRIVSSISDRGINPKEFELKIINYPNPFNAVTTFEYYLPTKGNAVISIYDLKGILIKIDLFEDQPPGKHEFRFDGTALSSGIYFYKIFSNSIIASGKMLLLK